MVICIALSICLPHCPPPQVSLASASLSLRISLSVSISICLPPLICVSPYQLESTVQNQNKPWLVGFGRCTVRLGVSHWEIFPSAKPQNNTGIFLFLNYSTVLNLILILSHALYITFLARHACILSYIIAFSALWFSSIILRLRSD